MGRVRAKQQRHPKESKNKILPVMVHGDSAFAGQGILAETLNLADLEGYEVGGTLHVIANNWIGFTTEPKAYSSTRFATDVAKRLPSPIFHVNGEDPDAVVRAARGWLASTEPSLAPMSSSISSDTAGTATLRSTTRP